MIGETIKNRRNKLGLTQEELVKKAREVYENENLQEEIKVFNQAQLSKWENGETKYKKFVAIEYNIRNTFF